jgi:rare lipoprotein A
MTPTSPTFRRVAAVLSTACFVFPAAAFAQDGGPTPGAGSGGAAQDGGAAPDSGGGTGGAAYAQPTDVVGTPALFARPQGLLGRMLRFRGTADPGERVAIQRLDQHLRTWLTATTAVAGSDGAYLARWRADHVGVFTVRAVGADQATVHASGAPVSITITVFKPALATWYGPGFYGKRTACGQRMSEDLIGVAHRGLPCGRSVAIFYGGHTIVAPVVDRGPFRDGASWDLTAAAARQLGFTQTDQIGAVSLPVASVAGTP